MPHKTTSGGVAARMLPAMQLRVTDVQKTYLLLVADREQCSVSEAVRRLLDEAIDREPRVSMPGANKRTGARATVSLRWALEHTIHDQVEPDPEWIARHGGGQ